MIDSEDFYLGKEPSEAEVLEYLGLAGEDLAVGGSHATGDLADFIGATHSQDGRPIIRTGKLITTGSKFAPSVITIHPQAIDRPWLAAGSRINTGALNLLGAAALLAGIEKKEANTRLKNLVVYRFPDPIGYRWLYLPTPVIIVAAAMQRLGGISAKAGYAKYGSDVRTPVAILRWAGFIIATTPISRKQTGRKSATWELIGDVHFGEKALAIDCPPFTSSLPLLSELEVQRRQLIEKSREVKTANLHIDLEQVGNAMYLKERIDPAQLEMDLIFKEGK